MLCLISFIFVFVIAMQYQAETISTGEAIFYALYGTLMFYCTSKPYWSSNNPKHGRKE